jgi:hypothetical protein
VFTCPFVYNKPNIENSGNLEDEQYMQEKNDDSATNKKNGL